jgi:opacity protein-like surface antigen
MKKLSILLAGLTIVSTVGFSQISIDPEVGLNISNVRTKIGDNDATTNDASIGFRAGAGIHLNLYKGLYLRPGIYYSMAGDKSELAGTTTNTTLHYLQIPVNLGYKYTISEKAGGIFAEAGPYIGYALSGTNKVDITGLGETKKDINFGDGIAEVNPLDWGFNFGLGYETPWGIYAKAGYGLGLGNMSNVDKVTVTNNLWNISLGYRIKI